MLVHYRKARETATEVEYAYGYPELDRTLLIDKQTRTGRPLTGPEDSRYGGVVYKILKSQAAETVWPETGTLAS